MAAYETHTVVSDERDIVLRDLPVEPGQRVKVTIELEDAGWPDRVAALQDLFRRTQALPGVSSVSDEDVVAEIAAYRSEAP